jgi:cold shock CspA family protein
VEQQERKAMAQLTREQGEQDCLLHRTYLQLVLAEEVEEAQKVAEAEEQVEQVGSQQAAGVVVERPKMEQQAAQAAQAALGLLLSQLTSKQ